MSRIIFGLCVAVLISACGGSGQQGGFPDVPPGPATTIGDPTTTSLHGAFEVPPPTPPGQPPSNTPPDSNFWKPDGCEWDSGAFLDTSVVYEGRSAMRVTAHKCSITSLPVDLDPRSITVNNTVDIKGVSQPATASCVDGECARILVRLYGKGKNLLTEKWFSVGGAPAGVWTPFAFQFFHASTDPVTYYTVTLASPDDGGPLYVDALTVAVTKN